MKRRITPVVLCILIILLFSGCYDFINVTDRGSDSYQGWTVYDDPSLLELISPADDATILYYRSEYELVCAEIIGAASYTFQVAEDEDFSTITLEGTPSENSFTINPSALTEGTAYYWRVKVDSGEYTDSMAFTVKEPAVGDYMEGGIVFYVDADNRKGLVAAEEDLGKAVWGWTNQTNASLRELFDGAENTEEIVSAYSRYYPDNGDYAAKLCDDLVLKGYEDWYLPSLEELNMLETLFWSGTGNFIEGYYWSSTERDYENAYSERFDWEDENYNSLGTKNKRHRVHPVRMFDYSANMNP